MLAVGRPFGAAFVGTGRRRQVARRPGLSGDREHVAASAEEGTFAVGRYLEVRHALADINQLLAAGTFVLQNADGNLDDLLLLEVVTVQPAAVLENDAALAQRGELHVELGEVGQLLRLL